MDPGSPIGVGQRPQNLRESAHRSRPRSRQSTSSPGWFLRGIAGPGAVFISKAGDHITSPHRPGAGRRIALHGIASGDADHRRSRNTRKPFQKSRGAGPDLRSHSSRRRHESRRHFARACLFHGRTPATRDRTATWQSSSEQLRSPGSRQSKPCESRAAKGCTPHAMDPDRAERQHSRNTCSSQNRQFRFDADTGSS